MTVLPKAFSLLTSFALSVSFSSALPEKLTPVLTQRCAPCHGPDLNGVGGVFPSLMTSELVKSGNMDEVIKFITHGSPADSQSLVKMPAKGGHLDLGDDEIRDIAKQVIELAKVYVEKKPSSVVSNVATLRIVLDRWCRPQSRPPRLWPGHQQRMRLSERRDFTKERRNYWHSFKKWEVRSMKELDWKIYPN